MRGLLRIPSDEETKKISSLQSFFEGFRKAISTAIQGLSGRPTRDFKAGYRDITIGEIVSSEENDSKPRSTGK